jgi:hypothetical protein
MAAIAEPRALEPESPDAPPESGELLPESEEPLPASGELTPESGAVVEGVEGLVGALGACPPPGEPVGEPLAGELDEVPPSGAPPHATSMARLEAAASENDRERVIEATSAAPFVPCRTPGFGCSLARSRGAARANGREWGRDASRAVGRGQLEGLTVTLQKDSRPLVRREPGTLIAAGPDGQRFSWNALVSSFVSEKRRDAIPRPPRRGSGARCNQ